MAIEGYMSDGYGTHSFSKLDLTSASAAAVAARAAAATPTTADDPATVRVLSGNPQQMIIGFGGALTEASAVTYAEMPADLQEEVVCLCYGSAEEGGNGYTLGRVHLQSSDFALGNYAYVTRPPRGADILSTFDISRERENTFPLVKDCLAKQPMLSLIAAPWSPPAFMKTNRNMNFGGHLRPSYYQAWARVLARAVRTWRDEGLPLDRLTVQNEPQAIQFWDSCLYSAYEEAKFAGFYLRQALEAEGCHDVKLLAWDHNKESLVERTQAIDLALRWGKIGDRALCKIGGMRTQPATSTFDNVFSGVAFHWYTGDFFDQVKSVHGAHPEAELIHTEGCEAFSRGRGTYDPQDAEHYAHDMIGDLRVGTNAYIDWNILLNEEGGPNHVGNFCDAPLMYNRETGELVKNRSFYYIGHLSRWIAPGSRIVPTHTAEGTPLETVAAVRPDGKRVLVVLNRTAHAETFTIEEQPIFVAKGAPGAKGAPEAKSAPGAAETTATAASTAAAAALTASAAATTTVAAATVPPHAIATFIWDA